MRLPKWVVKWVKDDFDFETLEIKCRQQEEEIKSLKETIMRYKFEHLPEDEKIGVWNVYLMMWWKSFGKERDVFREEYIKYKEDEEEARGLLGSLLF
jgi:hypothetical protein